jgi:hypothetical protein
VIALGVSACGVSRKVSAEPNVSTALAHLHFPRNVPAPLVSYIRTGGLVTADGTVSSVAVYGPDSRRELEEATGGGTSLESAKEKTMRFYLVVLKGHFFCAACAGPGSGKPRHGTVETDVWSAQERGTDFGFGNGAGADVSQLHRLATASVS